MDIDDLIISEYIVEEFEAFGKIRLKRMEQKDGSIKWKISQGTGTAMTTEGEIIFETQPSNRDEDYLKETRFKTREKALKVYDEKVRSQLKEENELILQKKKQ